MSIYAHLVKRENILLAARRWGKLICLLYVRKETCPLNLGLVHQTLQTPIILTKII